LQSNDYLVSHLTQSLFLHYLWKSDQPKYALKYYTKKREKHLNLIDRNLIKKQQILTRNIEHSPT